MAKGVKMQNIIATVSFDELNTKSSIKVKGTEYKVLHDYQLLVNKNGNLLKYSKNGVITEKSVFTNTLGYEFIIYRHKSYFVHRIVALAYGLLDSYDYDPDLEIDHINDVRDDNRICNLQVLSKNANLAKRKKTNNKKFELVRDGNVHTFNTKTECAQWLVDNGYSKGTLQHTKENIARNRSRGKLYGFEYKEL